MSPELPADSPCSTGRLLGGTVGRRHVTARLDKADEITGGDDPRIGRSVGDKR